MSKEEAIEFALNYLGQCITLLCPDGNLEGDYPEDLPNSGFKLFEVTAERDSEEDYWTVNLTFPNEQFDIYSGEPSYPDEVVNVCIFTDSIGTKTLPQERQHFRY